MCAIEFGGSSGKLRVTIGGISGSVWSARCGDVWVNV